MQRVIVAFQNSNINNFFCLPQGTIINNKKVLFTNQPRYDIVDGRLETNFDYLITDGTVSNAYSDNIVDMLPKEKVAVLRRYSKITQSIRLTKYVSKYTPLAMDSLNIIIPKVYFSEETLTLNHIVPNGIKVVIKPIHGARGIGQFVIDTSKVPFKTIHELIFKFTENKLEIDELFQKLEPWKDCYIYSKGTEHHEYEGLYLLKNGYMVQEYIDKVNSEYRVITDYKGDIAYCQKRSIVEKSPGYPQAIGSEIITSERDDIVDFSEEFSNSLVMSNFIKEVVGPMNSVDLFVTEDGKWGIFEHCNQFGMSGVPNEIAFKLHKDFISNMMKQKPEVSSVD